MDTRDVAQQLKVLTALQKTWFFKYTSPSPSPSPPLSFPLHSPILSSSLLILLFMKCWVLDLELRTLNMIRKCPSTELGPEPLLF